jgi:voltage-gated potassium channel
LQGSGGVPQSPDMHFPFTIVLSSPLIRRVTWYGRRITSNLDRRFFIALIVGIISVCTIAASLITLAEKPLNLRAFGQSLYWAITTIFGQGQPGYVTTPIGWLISWIMIILGVGLLATITGALVGVVINFLLKEGQGMGVSGYRDHIVVCGWNSTARELIDELRNDDRRVRIVLIHDADRNPAGEHVYYVKGDASEARDLERAGIMHAAAALVFPLEGSNDADMKSILIVMTIDSMAPQVRIVAEVNNPRHVDHFNRAGADELLVTSHLASRLLARSAIYPGLADLVSDLVSSGGSELYRVKIPAAYVGLTVEEAGVRFRREHGAIMVAVRRDDHAVFHGAPDFTLRADDDAVVIAESLGTMEADELGAAEQQAGAAWAKTRPMGTQAAEASAGR